MCELSEEGTDVPKHVAVVQNYTDMSVVCAFVWFYKWLFLKLLLLLLLLLELLTEFHFVIQRQTISGKRFSPVQKGQTGYGVHPASVSVAKRLGRKTDH